MKFHVQTTSHLPHLGKIGDCFRTALASILDLEQEEVPHFLSIYFNPEGVEIEAMKKHTQDWLATKGYTMIDVPYFTEGAPQSLMAVLGERDGEILLYMLTGKSSTANHIVICRGSKLLWDPSGLNNNLIGPIDGVYWVSYLLPINMRYNP